MAENTVTIVGNVTRDPELRYTAGGQAKASFGVAVSRRWQNRQTNEWEEQTSFLNVVCWRELAENVADSIAKGSRVIVTGRMEQRSWETDTGDKRSVVEVVADDVGPSLKWATAAVVRNERHTGNSGRAPSGSTERTRQARHESAAQNVRADIDYEYGEEPF
jgi:single-strand DNA-binding protein